MSTKYPIISVVGSSGAGTSTVKDTFEKIFLRENVCVINKIFGPKKYFLLSYHEPMVSK